MPIPTENLMLFKIKSADRRDDGNHSDWSLMSNCNTEINYAYIYRVVDEINIGDSVQIYYFYQEGYDLSYKYMYDFYFKYLYYKFGGPVESILNALYFKDIDVEKLIKIAWDDIEYTSDDITALVVNDGALERSNIRNLYNFILGLSEINSNTSAEIDYDLYLLNSDLLEQGEIPKEPTSLTEFWTVFRFIVEHPMVDYRYDDIDYLENYQKTTTPFEYKINKLKEFISDDVDILRNYVIEQRKVGMSYSFYTYEIDMDKHIVTKTEGSKIPNLPCPMYMFCFDNKYSDMYLGVRVFIDGIFYDQFMEEDFKFIKYIYIPVVDIPENAFIEFEVFYSYKDSKDIRFNSMDDSITLEYSFRRIMPTLSDLHIVNKSNVDIEYDKSLFKFEVVSEKYDYYINGYDGETSNVVPVNFDMLYGTFKDVENGESTINFSNTGVTHSNMNMIRVSPNSDLVTGVDLLFVVNKTPDFIHKEVGVDDHYPFFPLNPDMKNIDSEYIRLFRGGKLLSKNLYTFTEQDGKFGVHVLDRLSSLTNVTVDVTPYKNRLIYYQKELKNDLVNLKKYINKPIDIRYYDIYLNGRKLNKNNICQISPWEIKLIGIHSVYNLEVYERDRDWEYYGVEFTNYFTLSDLIEMKFIEDEIIDKLIHDVTGDVPENDDSEPKENWEQHITEKTLFFEMFYYDRLLPLELASADFPQFEFSDIYNNFKIIWSMYSYTSPNNKKTLLLNPDVHTSGTDGVWSVYMLGNSDSSIKKLIKGDDMHGR